MSVCWALVVADQVRCFRRGRSAENDGHIHDSTSFVSSSSALYVFPGQIRSFSGYLRRQVAKQTVNYAQSGASLTFDVHDIPVCMWSHVSLHLLTGPPSLNV